VVQAHAGLALRRLHLSLVPGFAPGLGPSMGLYHPWHGFMPSIDPLGRTLPRSAEARTTRACNRQATGECVAAVISPPTTYSRFHAMYMGVKGFPAFRKLRSWGLASLWLPHADTRTTKRSPSLLSGPRGSGKFGSSFRGEARLCPVMGGSSPKRSPIGDGVDPVEPVEKSVWRQKEICQCRGWAKPYPSTP
jgi:hypothetical protein